MRHRHNHRRQGDQEFPNRSLPNRPFAMRGPGPRGAGRPGFGRGGESGPSERQGRRRMFEGGELRLVMLLLIEQEPRHGYDIIREIEARTGGAYAPSPGIIYPTLTLLEETGLIETQIHRGREKAVRHHRGRSRRTGKKSGGGRGGAGAARSPAQARRGDGHGPGVSRHEQSQGGAATKSARQRQQGAAVRGRRNHRRGRSQNRTAVRGDMLSQASRHRTERFRQEPKRRLLTVETVTAIHAAYAADHLLLAGSRGFLQPFAGRSHQAVLARSRQSRPAGHARLYAARFRRRAENFDH